MSIYLIIIIMPTLLGMFLPALFSWIEDGFWDGEIVLIGGGMGVIFGIVVAGFVFAISGVPSSNSQEDTRPGVVGHVEGTERPAQGLVPIGDEIDRTKEEVSMYEFGHIDIEVGSFGGEKND
jgi:hypothetical protein